MCRARKFRFGTYDIETQSIDSDEFALVGFFDGERYFCFRSIAEFLEHTIDRRYAGWRMFAHFGGRFDGSYLFDWLKHHGLPSSYGWSYSFSGSTAVQIRIYDRNGHAWTFVDSGRLLPVAQERLTKEFRVPHPKLPREDVTDVHYNYVDCRGLYEVLERFFGITNLTSYTIASHALRFFRANYLDRIIWSVPTEVENFVRRAYVGGRCEIYRRDEARVKKYDINSLYPHAMRGPIPVDFIGHTRTVPDDDRTIGFFHAEVSVPEMYLPPLAWLAPERRLYFPVGRIRGWWSSMELRRAERCGARILRIIDGVRFGCEPIFDAFVDDVYSRKLASEQLGDYGLRMIYKLLGNSLYGKFGQRRDRKVYIPDPGTSRLDPDDPESPWIYPLPDGMAFYVDMSKSAHILPHIAATVTARARMHMFDLLTSVSPVWYTDTDSILTTAEMPTSSECGGLKLEGVGRFRAHGLKEYEWDNEVKIKGLSLRGPERDEIARAYLRGEPVRYRRRMGIREAIRAGTDAARTIECVRRKRAVHPKRAPDGEYDTRPWDAREISASS